MRGCDRQRDLSVIVTSHSNLFQYLSDEVLVHLRPEQHDFLLQTAFVEELSAHLPPEEQATYRQIRVLLDEKGQLLTRARRDISFKAMMDLWLYFHVPISFGLLAALAAHVISVFFYW